jgi:catechol 2,3-dioxygenase-like lactoylglutathione lyase family enzyme
MLKGINHLAIYAKDSKGLIDWYTDVLGFQASTDNDGRYFLGLADGSYLQIIEAEGEGQSLQGKESGLHHIAFTVDDFDGLVKKIREQNLEVLMEPKETDDGRKLFSFRDIEGNFLQFVYYIES